MEFSATIKINDIKYVVENEEETVRAMGVAIKDTILRNLSLGRDAKGQMPQPKDTGPGENGNRPWHRTGTLARSIGVQVRQASRKVFGPQRSDKQYAWVAVVRPFGDRPESEDIQRKKRNAAAKTKSLRNEKLAKLADDHQRGNVIPSRFLRKIPSQSGNIFRVGSIRRRAADTNAALAGILSQKPNDLRGKNGNRKQYRVMAPNDQSRRAAQAACRNVMRAKLVVKKA